jgi:hypothetical protein
LKLINRIEVDLKNRLKLSGLVVSWEVNCLSVQVELMFDFVSAGPFIEDGNFGGSLRKIKKACSWFFLFLKQKKKDFSIDLILAVVGCQGNKRCPKSAPQKF